MRHRNNPCLPALLTIYTPHHTHTHLHRMTSSVPELPGFLAPPEGAREIMFEVMRLLHRPTAGFPGAQPISFSKRHIQSLLSEDFLVCEKSDGLRCLMLLSEFIDEDGRSDERIYLITRKSEVSWVQNLHVPADSGSRLPFQVGTLIDGELVKSNDGKIRFFMFDLLSHQGKVLTDRDLAKRLGYLEKLVFRPFQDFCTAEPEAAQQFDFKIYMKTMSQSYRLDSVLTQSRDHSSDGLIFTSVSAPYVYGTDQHILKWKPASENSVDFAIRLDFINSDDPDLETDYYSKPTVTLLAWNGKTDNDFGELYITDEEWIAWKKMKEPLNYRIAEVIRDAQLRWRFLRFRDDKEHGNHIDVVHKVIESIEDSITLDELSGYTSQIRENWEQRQRKRAREQSGTEEGGRTKRSRPNQV